MTYTLRNALGNWAGILYSHFDLPESHQAQFSKCELVAISAGHVLETSEEQGLLLIEWDCEERPRDVEFYSFYHALWIETIDGISYRKGLARVPEIIWDDLQKENVELHLG